MKKNLVISVILLLALIISSCNSSVSNKNKSPISDINIYKGTEGLDFDFLKDAPPSDLYQNQTFQITTLIKNKGAYPISNAKMVASFDSQDFDFLSQKSFSFSMKGKELYNPTNDEVVKNFYVKAVPLLPNSVFLQSSILLTVCYDYSNKLNTEVCVDTDPFNLKPVEKACKMTDLSFSGQGSPVTVTKIEQKMVTSESGYRPQFKIYMKNAGKGQVVSKEKVYEVCGSQQIDRDSINVITLKDVRFSKYSKNAGDIECEPQNLRLINNEDYFICTLKEESIIPRDEATFKTNFYLEYEYGYTLSKSKDINIRKMNVR